jgi:hypothetical protein
MKALPMAHFVLKTPESSACVMRAPWVDEPWISKRTLEEKLARVYAQPYYVQRDTSHDTPELARRAPVRAIAAESAPLTVPMKDITPQQPLLPDVLSPAHTEEPDDTDEPAEQDFLF